MGITVKYTLFKESETWELSLLFSFEFTFEVIDGVQPGSGVLPGRPLKIFNEGFAPVDQRKPLAVMVDPLLQNGDGPPEFARSSVELLGLIHLIATWRLKAEQSIRLLLQGARGSVQVGLKLAAGRVLAVDDVCDRQFSSKP